MFPPDPGKGWREEQQEIIQVFFWGGEGRLTDGHRRGKGRARRPPKMGDSFFSPVNQSIKSSSYT